MESPRTCSHPFFFEDLYLGIKQEVENTPNTSTCPDSYTSEKNRST